MIGNLQVLRAFAASGVVIYHSHANIFGVQTEFHGVALFFVLSGYLMCRICNRSSLEFAIDRFWRIVPSYWLAMALMLTLFNMWTYWPLEHTVLSALFIPHDSLAGLHPVLGVGWTLNIEMYFYLVFAFSIFISRSYAPLIVVATIIAVMFGLPLVSENKAALHYFTHPYIYFFLAGIGIWYLTEWPIFKEIRLKLPPWFLPVSVAIYAISVVFFAAGGIAVVILFFLAILASNHGADIKNKTLILLGNASYACYLLHTILIEFLRHRGIPSSGSLLFTSGVFIGSWSLAILWHIYVEKFISNLHRRSARVSMQSNS